METKQAEEEYKSLPLLSLKGCIPPANIPFDEFILRFFNDYNIKYYTHEVGWVRAQCSYNAARSIGDIYRICLSYYSGLSLLTLRNKLTELIRNDIVVGHFCMDIKKNVYAGKKARPYWFGYNSSSDEHGWNILEFEKNIEEKIEGVK